jgi:hypothetical protein
MAINFFIPDIGKTGPPDYEYAIGFHQKCFVLELFHRKYSVRPPSWIDFQKIIFWVTWPVWRQYPRYQVDKVLPYQFEPKLGLQTSDSGDESDSEEQSESSQGRI